MLTLVDTLKSTLHSSCKNIKLLLFVVSLIFLFLQIILNILFTVAVKRNFKKVDLLNRHSIFLIPQLSLFLDQRFITHLRAYIIRHNMNFLLE